MSLITSVTYTQLPEFSIVEFSNSGQQGSSSVRSRFLVLFLLLGTVPCTRAADSGPVDCTHLVAWTSGAVPNRKLISIIEARGIAFAPTEKAIAEIRNAGATSRLLEVLQKAKPQGATTCPASLAQAGALIRSKNLVDAANIVDALTDKDPRNDALHFLMGAFARDHSSPI